MNMATTMEKKPGNNRGKTMAAVILIIGAIVLALFAGRFIHHRMQFAVTDAVFVNSDSLTTIGFDRVDGRIIEMRKKEGDPVTIGEVLATVDDEPYRLEAERLSAELAAAERELEGRRLLMDRLRQEIGLNEEIAASQVKQLGKKEAALDAKAAAVQAVIDQLGRDQQRMAALYEAKAVAKRRTEDVGTDLAARTEEKKAVQQEAAALQASQDAARLQVDLAKTKRLQIKETEKSIQAQEEKIKGLIAAFTRIESDRRACQLVSPAAGRIAKRYAGPGSIASPKKAIYSLVDPADIFIIALLEENKLKGVVPGAEATIKIDAYPDLKFTGTVSQVLPASAATFALAPRDLSAGEFTKVAQRIPVRITFTSGDISLLSIGLGGEVEIRRKDG